MIPRAQVEYDERPAEDNEHSGHHCVVWFEINLLAWLLQDSAVVSEPTRQHACRSRDEGKKAGLGYVQRVAARGPWQRRRWPHRAFPPNMCVIVLFLYSVRVDGCDKYKSRDCNNAPFRATRFRAVELHAMTATDMRSDVNK